MFMKITVLMSFYLMQDLTRDTKTLGTKLWDLKIYEKLKLNLWRIVAESFLWWTIEDNTCSLCKLGKENCIRLFGECSFTRIAWRQFEWPIWNACGATENYTIQDFD